MRASLFGTLAGGGSGTPKILDGITSTIWGAYGIYQLRSAYSGAAIRVKDSLNVQADIGFLANGTLDIASLSGNTPYRIITIYDQSGNARNGTSAKVAGAGAVDLTLNTTDPSMYFNDCYIAYPDMSALTAGEIFTAAQLNAEGVDTGYWAMGTGGSSFVPFSDGNIYDDWGSTVRKNGIAFTPGQMAARYVYDVYSAANDWANYLNDTQLRQTGTNTVGFSATPIMGRDDPGSGGVWFAGKMFAQVIFSEKVTSGERTTLNTGL